LTFRTFHAYNYDTNNTYPSEIDINDPRQCMHCLQTGVQNFITGVVTDGQHDKFNSVSLYTCPLCSSTTIHFSFIWREGMSIDGGIHTSVETFPVKLDKTDNISPELEVMFTDFFEIYYQSQKAENENLNQLAGMGYRKSLEFLVTDYLLQYPVDDAPEDWLKNANTTLGNKISKIPSGRMQTLAKAASFLGNDETHYTRRHPEHDIESMKAFIRVLLTEIENEIEFKKAEELINKPKN